MLNPIANSGYTFGSVPKFICTANPGRILSPTMTNDDETTHCSMTRAKNQHILCRFVPSYRADTAQYWSTTQPFIQYKLRSMTSEEEAKAERKRRRLEAWRKKQAEQAAAAQAQAAAASGNNNDGGAPPPAAEAVAASVAAAPAPPPKKRVTVSLGLGFAGKKKKSKKSKPKLSKPKLKLDEDADDDEGGDGSGTEEGGEVPPSTNAWRLLGTWERFGPLYWHAARS